MNYSINNQAVLDEVPAMTPNGIELSSSGRAFIEANTIQMPVDEMQKFHIIPVWTSTNEPLISHSEFIETVWAFTNSVFHGEEILKPSIRCSHAIKGRIPEAKHKTASQLEPWEETLYYERMMFVIEIKSIKEKVNGNEMTLMLGGVKSYNNDNIYGKRSQGNQHFQMFIGYQNKVCCNLSVCTNGLKWLMNIQSLSQLKHELKELIVQFNAKSQLEQLRQFDEFELLEQEFANVVGRARMYRHMPEKQKQDIFPFMLGDQQLANVVGSYYHDENFKGDKYGSINLWKFYNLLTGANKSSYIDTFLVKSANATDFVNEVLKSKTSHHNCWYLG